MKRLLLFLIALAVVGAVTAQNRGVTRGAVPGELYLVGGWYATYDKIWGPPYCDTMQCAFYRLTENGKKLTIQYDTDCLNPDPITSPLPEMINADATTGVLYCRNYYGKSDGYTYTSLWVSFDYGKNWTFRDENKGQFFYYAANFEGLIYRGGGGVSESSDYANTWKLKHQQGHIYYSETYFKECEFFGISGSNPSPWSLYYTNDCYQSFLLIPIEKEYVFGTMASRQPDVYRGGLPGEVYITSWFPDYTYKASFSADTGRTFRHIYISDVCPPASNLIPIFMSDREPGVFYIFRYYYIDDIAPPGGMHIKLCIEHYADYGETLVATYCHDLHKDYGKTCEAVTDLFSEKYSDNCVLLTWSEPESSLPVENYHLYRNSELLSATTTTSYTDENLPAGSYEYYVVTYYEMGCVSDSSNRVIETIEIDCEAITDLSAEKIGNNSILLTWTDPNDVLQIEKYSVFRNDIPLTEVANTFYLDENLPVGNYEYCLIAHYTNGCISDTSNCVIETVGVGIGEIGEMDGIVVYPNPTTGEVFVGMPFMASLQNVEIFDLMGRIVAVETRRATSLNETLNVKPENTTPPFGHPTTPVPNDHPYPSKGGELEGNNGGEFTLDISNAPSGIYFVRIQTETSVVTRKIIKY